MPPRRRSAPGPAPDTEPAGIPGGRPPGAGAIPGGPTPEAATPAESQHGPPEDPIYRRIREAVVAGRLPPGTKLAEEKLAAAFGVNRLRVRESLRLLSFAGIVELIANRGAFVARPTRQDSLETYAARRLIEDEVVALAVRHITPAGLDRLRDHVARQRAAEAAGDRPRLVGLLGEFHRVLAQAAGNRTLLGFVEQLVARTSLIIALYERHDPAPCAVDEHAELVELIAAGDVAGAVANMRHHLGAVEERLRFEPERPDTPIDFEALFAE